MTQTTTTPQAFGSHHLQEWLATGRRFTIIDVRSPAEFEACHIPGAYNVPLDTLGEHRAALRAHLDEPVVLVCRSGMRAAQAERSFAEVGMDSVHVLAGGMSAWERAGGAVRRGPQRWDIERQVRLVAGALVLISVLGSLLFRPAKWFAAGVGGGLVVAALSNSCLMGNLLARLPYNRSAACNVDEVVAQLTGAQPPAKPHIRA
jgi:rhodanese-related sulfurtransferase